MMRASTFDFIGNLDTLLAVMVGALLATIGALVSELIQNRLGQKRRQRDAARFFAEILTSADQIFQLACDSRKIGDPWGSYTATLFETVTSEASVYERNRERLFDILDMKLRFALHGHMLRFTVPIAAIVKHSEHIEALKLRLDEGEGVSEAVREGLQARLRRLEEMREGSLRAAEAERAGSVRLLEQLEALSGARFEGRY